METKKTFIRYISHEIRSPLSTASLGLDYLVAQMADNRLSYEQVLEVVRDAKTATEIATSTLNDLLMFDKIETGMLEVALTDCDMWEFVNHCVKPFNIQVCCPSNFMKVNNYLIYAGLCG
jgi:signal transduction histidine kinase